MWSRALCISSGWPLGRVKKNTRHHLPTDLDQCVCKCMPQVFIKAEALTHLWANNNTSTTSWNTLWHLNIVGLLQVCLLQQNHDTTIRLRRAKRVCAHICISLLHLFLYQADFIWCIQTVHFWDASSRVRTLGLPLLQVAVSQCAIDELIGCPLQREIIPRLMERQVTP